LKAVNFLVLANEGLDLSWQIPLSDFFTTGSAALSAAVTADIPIKPQTTKTLTLKNVVPIKIPSVKDADHLNGAQPHRYDFHFSKQTTGNRSGYFHWGFIEFMNIFLLKF
jgi:hypothetical protein